MAEQAGRTATRADMLVNFVQKLGDIAKGIVSSIGSLVDGLKGSAFTIEKISNEIAQTNALFAMQLKSFSKELKLLDNYYTKVYIQTKAMVEFGMNEKVIPNIESLINVEDYHAAIREIRSFLDILAGRIKDIIDELNKHDEKVALSEDLQEKIKKLTEKYEKSKQHLENMVEEQRNAECHRIGKNIVLVSLGVSTGTMLLYGNDLVREKLEQATTYMANNPQVLSFFTDKGIRGLKAMTSLEPMHPLQIMIEENTKEMSKRFHNFFVKLTEFQIQISTIVDNTEELKKCMESLQEKAEDESDVTRKSTTEWVNISVTLQQMFELFKNLDVEVVQKEISWETDHEIAASPV